jgi:1-deoxy-D-xylulose-5-phosphate reductoisomerase
MSAVPLRNNKAAASAVRSVTVLGATGSIGDSTIDLLRAARDRYRVEALTGNNNVERLAELAKEFGARFVAVADPKRLGELKSAVAGTRIQCGAGESAVIEAAARPADWVMAAVSGAAGLKPALAAVDRGATVALANKECLVCAGDFFMQRALKAGACILPADSEHNALFQALSSGNREELVRVIITASGGPFRTWSSADIEQATLAQALKHPNWSMGQKITIDSASMMNKGLEVIEASYLFSLAPEEIDVLVHPQSIIHGMVEFSDRSVVAQCARPSLIASAGRIASRAPPQSSILPKSASSPSRLRISSDFPACGSPTTPYVLAAVRRPCTMPQTRLRWLPSSPARSGSEPSRGW